MKIHRCVVSLVLGLGAFASLASPLEDIERWAQESSDALSIADLDTQIAKERLEFVRADSGAKWTLGATVGQYQEPLTSSTSRNYGSINATGGIRIPLLGSAATNQRNVDEASRIARVNALQRELQRIRIVREVRLAYSAYVRNNQKSAVAQAWLSQEAMAAPALLARTREHALLEADRMAMHSAFHVARRDRDRYLLAQEGALATLRRLSKQPLNDLPPEPTVWSTACVQRQSLLDALDRSPAVAIKRLELEARQKQTQLMRWSGMEAGLSLQQSLGADFGGQGSQATVLGIDMSIPFGRGLSNRARGNEAQLKVQQAQIDLNQTLAEETDALDGMLGRLRISKTDLERSQQNLDTSVEANRIADLRAHNMPGDVLEKALMARYGLYLASIDHLDTLQRADASHIDVLAYGVSCPQARAEDTISSPLFAMLALPALPNALSTARAASAQEEMKIAWFLWQGKALLKTDPLPLPPVAGRLQVSFTGNELSTIASDAETAQNLRNNLALLHNLGWKVDVLFGDATFVLPAGRQRLVQYVQTLTGFHFDGVNLDLERSDLPARLQPQWWKLTLATLRAVHASCPWPLTLTTHYREFEKASRGIELQQAGAASVMAMVYVNNQAAATSISQRILSRQTGLPMRVVQSVETQLPYTESSFAMGRNASMMQWHEISQRLATFPNFQGMAVQSLEHFNAMEP